MRFLHPLRPLLLGWVLSLLGWSCVAFAMASSGVATRGDAWSDHLEPSLRAWLMWAGWTPLIFRFAARLPLGVGPHRKLIPAHLAALLVVVLSVQAWKNSFTLGGDPPRMDPRPPDRRTQLGRTPASHPLLDGDRRSKPGNAGPRRFDLLRLLSTELPIYLMLLAGAHAVFYYRREQERTASLARARLDSLRAQLHPHFLFNSLNAIAGLVHEDPDRADALLSSLASLLRRSLEASDAQTTSFDCELEFVRSYLELMHARFDDRVCFNFVIAPDTASARVPPMLLQPLIENAIEHGLRPQPGGGTVTVRAVRDGDNLRIEVVDDGVGPFPPGEVSEQVGLGNTRARLCELYGTRASLALTRVGTETIASIVLPFESANP